MKKNRYWLRNLGRKQASTEIYSTTEDHYFSCTSGSLNSKNSIRSIVITKMTSHRLEGTRASKLFNAVSPWQPWIHDCGVNSLDLTNDNTQERDGDGFHCLIFVITYVFICFGHVWYLLFGCYYVVNMNLNLLNCEIDVCSYIIY